MTNPYLQFWRVTRHVPPRQLLRRCWLNLQRRMIMSPLGALSRRRRPSVLPLADAVPQAIFSPRTHLIKIDGGQHYLTQLGGCWELKQSTDWALSGEPHSTHLQRLAMHYFEFLECVEASLGEQVLLDWIQQNPPWQPGFWLDSWNSYAVSIRVTCTMQWLERHLTTLSESSGATILSSVVEQVRFLSGNLETDIRGNHLVKNIKALLWAGRFFAGSEAERWFRTGLSLLNSEVKDQFLADGCHFELSPAYHCQVFADFLECASLLDASERQAIISQLSQPAQFIADMTHPDERISLFSDGGLNMAYLPAECLSVYGKLGGTVPQPRAEFSFDKSGYYGLHGTRSHIFIDSGPSCADQLPAHGHGDILSFEWDVDEQRIVVDAGVYEYEVGPERQWNRSTRAHNTVTVGNRDQCEFVRNFRVGRRSHGRCEKLSQTDAQLHLSGACQYACEDSQHVNHRRSFIADDNSIVVDDAVLSGRPEPAVARLLLHHDCKPELTDENTCVIAAGCTRVLLSSNQTIRLRSAAWCPNFGERHITTQIEILYGDTPCHAGFRLQILD